MRYDEMKHSMRHEYFIGKLTGERQMNDLGFCFAVNWEYASWDAVVFSSELVF